MAWHALIWWPDLLVPQASMLRDLFVPDISVWEKILRPLIVYAFLLVGLRLAGKRALAQLTPFDLVVALMLANAVQNAIIGNDNSVTGGLIGASTLLVANYLVVRFLYRHGRIEHLAEGNPLPLIDQGRVVRKHLEQ